MAETPLTTHEEHAELLFRWRKMLLETLVKVVSPGRDNVQECAAFLLRNRETLRDMLALMTSLVAMDETAEKTLMKKIPEGKIMLRPLVEKALRMAKGEVAAKRSQEVGEWVKR